jgi:hypothetical protein
MFCVEVVSTNAMKVQILKVVWMMWAQKVVQMLANKLFIRDLLSCEHCTKVAKSITYNKFDNIIILEIIHNNFFWN